MFHHLIVPAVAFAIASSPMTYKLTRKVAGSWVSNFEGVATPAGLFLHTLFFLLILYLVGRFMPQISMYRKQRTGETPQHYYEQRGIHFYKKKERLSNEKKLKGMAPVPGPL